MSMTPKEIIFEEQAREMLRRGIKKLAEVVKPGAKKKKEEEEKKKQKALKQKEYKDRLIAFYTLHNPEKLLS